jgi:hypothetical protein
VFIRIFRRLPVLRWKVWEIPREEDFPEFPLLRDRLFLAEQRAIREELENRCPTPEITYADDDPDRPPDNPPSNPSTFTDPRPWTVAPTVLQHSLDRETASSSLYNASNYYSTPSTHPALSCVTPAPSAFKRSRPVFKPRTVEKRLPASSLRCIPRFQHETLSNLLETNEFLSVTPVSVLQTRPTYKSTFTPVQQTESNLSNPLREKNVPGLYPLERGNASYEASGDSFLYENLQNIIPTLRVELLTENTHLMVKKNPVQPLRRGSNPQTRRRNPLMESEYENSTLEENCDLPASYADDNPDEGDMDMESFPSDQHLTDLEECGEIPYDAQSPFQELVETDPLISSSSSSS